VELDLEFCVNHRAIGLPEMWDAELGMAQWPARRLGKFDTKTLIDDLVAAIRA